MWRNQCKDFPFEGSEDDEKFFKAIFEGLFLPSNNFAENDD